MSDASPSAECSNHPERPAEATCSVCGLGLCSSCRRSDGVETLCERCLAARAESTAPPPVADTAGSSEPPPPDTEPAPTGPVPEPVAEERPVEPEAPPSSPPATTAPPLVRLPAGLYLLLALQLLATLILAWVMLGRAPGPGAGLPPPRLDRPPQGTRFDTAEDITGEAPAGDFVALQADRQLIAFALVQDGRFAFRGLELGPGEYRLAAIAYSRDGRSASSAPLTLTIAPRATPEVSPTTLPTGSPPAATRPTPVTRTEPGARARARATVASRRNIPAPTSQPRSHPLNVLSGPRGKRVALTFDGGSNDSQAELVLDALAAAGVHSTLFLTGDFIARYPDITRRIVADGHEVGNHTLDHPHLADWDPVRGHITRPGVTREFLRHQLNETRRRFELATGAHMTSYWRAPYGEVNREILAWAAADGWTHVGWSDGLDTLDWVSDPSDRRYHSAAEIRDRLLARARSGKALQGGIVLMHLGADRTTDQAAAELAHIIEGLHRQGYRLVTISDLLGG